MEQDDKVVPISRGVGAKGTSGIRDKIDINASQGASNPLDADSLHIAVDRILHYGTYRESKHARNDRAYRNISDDDIVACLEGPWVLVGQEFGTRDWKYQIRGRDIEGDELGLVIVVDTDRQLIEIVTKF